MKLQSYMVLKTSCLLGLIAFSTIAIFVSLSSLNYVMFNDAELLPDGNFMVCQYEILREPGTRATKEQDAVLMIGDDNHVSRVISYPDVPLDQPHEALVKADGNVIIANCRNDTIVEVDPGNNVVWRYDIRKLNWTLVNPAFGPNNIMNNPKGDDWSHVNDVELETRDSAEYMLISVRNFDMVFEVNYTAARNRTYPDESDITWYFGFPGNHSMLNQQHNTDYLPNGNIMVADSENKRIVEINRTSKTLAWTSPPSLDLFWVRDADQSPHDEALLLITDSLHHRVIEYNKTANVITWEYSGNLVQPYQADYVDENRVLISDGEGGHVFILNKMTGAIEREYKTPNGSAQYVELIFFLIMLVIGMYIIFKIVDGAVFKHISNRRKYATLLIVAIGELAFFLYTFLFPQWFLKTIVITINAIVRG